MGDSKSGEEQTPYLIGNGLQSGNVENRVVMLSSGYCMQATIQDFDEQLKEGTHQEEEMNSHQGSIV